MRFRKNDGQMRGSTLANCCFAAWRSNITFASRGLGAGGGLVLTISKESLPANVGEPVGASGDWEYARGDRRRPRPPPLRCLPLHKPAVIAVFDHEWGSDPQAT